MIEKKDRLMETFVTEKYEMILGGAKRFHLPEFNLQSETQFLGCRYPDITATKNTNLACDKRRQNHFTDRTILQTKLSYRQNHPTDRTILQTELSYRHSHPRDRTILQTELFYRHSHPTYRTILQTQPF